MLNTVKHTEMSRVVALLVTVVGVPVVLDVSDVVAVGGTYQTASPASN